MSGKTTVVTTFAGRGGSSIGYTNADCKVLLAIDFEPNAVKTYKLNFPKTTVWKRDIRTVTGSEILKEIGLKAGQLDIFDGSPPCTSFSAAGKREEGWGKKYKHGSESIAQVSDDLFFEYIRLVGELRPKAFIAENVRGLIQGTAKGYYNSILKAFKKTGYRIRVFDLNAKDFEVPQSRPRIIFVGIRQDIKADFPPLKTHKPITFADATKDVIISDEDMLAARKAVQRPSVARFLKYTRPGENFAKYHPKGSYFTYVRVRSDRPCNTITAGSYLQMFHPTEERALTVAEARRCASFPDDYKFLSLPDAWVGIGNSVPPNLIKNIALYVKKMLAS